MGQSSSPSSLLQATKIYFPTWKHFNNVSSITFKPTYTVSNWIRQFPVGLSPWPETARTIKSSIIDRTFIHYWGINFTVRCPSWHKIVISPESWVFLPQTLPHQYTSTKLNQHANCPDLLSDCINKLCYHPPLPNYSRGVNSHIFSQPYPLINKWTFFLLYVDTPYLLWIPYDNYGEKYFFVASNQAKRMFSNSINIIRTN